MYPGLIKQQLADWQVTEIAAFEHSGDGEHAYFYVQKVGINTMDLVQEVAAAFDVPRVDVGYAGRKDKQGITQQWLSVRTTSQDWPAIAETECLATTRHQKKLRIGELARNRFQITLREPTVERDILESLQQGFPNAFGEQRVSESNVEQATHWLLTEREKRSDRRRRGNSRGRKVSPEGWHLSVLRSFLFNQVLGARLRTQDRGRAGIPVLEGDVLAAGFPSAPLWGRGRSSTQAAALAIEAEALAPYSELSEALEHTGVQQARRALWAVPRELKVVRGDEDSFVLSFDLAPGVYATSLLAYANQIAPQGAASAMTGRVA